jgi:hypothetical protein
MRLKTQSPTVPTCPTETEASSQAFWLPSPLGQHLLNSGLSDWMKCEPNTTGLGIVLELNVFTSMM